MTERCMPPGPRTFHGYRVVEVQEGQPQIVGDLSAFTLVDETVTVDGIVYDEVKIRAMLLALGACTECHAGRERCRNLPAHLVKCCPDCRHPEQPWPKRSREDTERIIAACREMIQKLHESRETLPHGI